jgi:hypothetical protein
MSPTPSISAVPEEAPSTHSQEEAQEGEQHFITNDACGSDVITPAAAPEPPTDTEDKQGDDDEVSDEDLEEDPLCSMPLFQHTIANWPGARTGLLYAAFLAYVQRKIAHQSTLDDYGFHFKQNSS